MKVIILSFLYFFVLPFLFFSVLANKEKSGSAYFNEKPVIVFEDKRVIKLRTYLEYKNSPLSDYAGKLIDVSDFYQLPWSLTAAIAGVETNFCKNTGLTNFNCWGWQNGHYRFDNFDEAIETVSKSLRTNYFDRNLTTLFEIGQVYASDKNWADKVNFFSQNIENFRSFELLSLQFSL